MKNDGFGVVTLPVVIPPRNVSPRMKLVVVESPYAGDVGLNLRYLRAAMFDCLHRNEAPFASHALYTQFLDDANPDERALGMIAGFAWGEAADMVAVYEDLGVSPGMSIGIKRALKLDKKIEFRRLGSEWSKEIE